MDAVVKNNLSKETCLHFMFVSKTAQNYIQQKKFGEMNPLFVLFLALTGLTVHIKYKYRSFLQVTNLLIPKIRYLGLLQIAINRPTDIKVS